MRFLILMLFVFCSSFVAVAQDANLNGFSFNKIWFEDSLGCNGNRDFSKVIQHRDAFLNCSPIEIISIFGEPNHIEDEPNIIYRLIYGIFSDGDCEEKDSLLITRKSYNREIHPSARLSFLVNIKTHFVDDIILEYE